MIDPIDPNNSQDVDPYLIKTDSIGNVEWSRLLGNPDCREDYVTVDLSINGKIICGTSYSDTCWGYGDNLGKINVSTQNTKVEYIYKLQVKLYDKKVYVLN